MQRIVWGRATSSNVMKVLWGLGELGLPFERIDVGGSFGKTDTADYRAMNPTGLVPTLQEDGFTLWESNAILRHLCHAHAPQSSLWPQDPQARANVDRWMDAQQTQLNRPMGVVFWGLVRTPPDKRDPAAIAQGVADAAKAYGLIEPELAKHAYIAGPAFTLADIPWGVHAHRWFNMDFDRPPLPHVRAWYDRLCERPAYRQHIVACPIV
ncbi:MAG TPA: glutathione S-transferase [Acetobacteraceae bacterium]|jgi:glutathione S-transferase|nr:glutathione S-transferase [Acetobacteraceae bacterium]